MSRSVTIPNYMTPYWRCNINNVEYAYLAGTTQTVPDEVAALIDQYNAAQPKEGPRPIKVLPEELPIASARSLGAVKIGANFSLKEDGTLSPVVPIMTPTVRGGAKLGAGLDVTDGVLSVANRVIGFYRSDSITEATQTTGYVEFTVPDDVTADNAICLISFNSNDYNVVKGGGWKIDTTSHKLVCGYATSTSNVTFTLCAVLIYAPKPAEAAE